MLTYLLTFFFNFRFRFISFLEKIFGFEYYKIQDAFLVSSLIFIFFKLFFRLFNLEMFIWINLLFYFSVFLFVLYYEIMFIIKEGIIKVIYGKLIPTENYKENIKYENIDKLSFNIFNKQHEQYIKKNNYIKYIWYKSWNNVFLFFIGIRLAFYCEPFIFMLIQNGITFLLLINKISLLASIISIILISSKLILILSDKSYSEIITVFKFDKENIFKDNSTMEVCYNLNINDKLYPDKKNSIIIWEWIQRTFENRKLLLETCFDTDFLLVGPDKNNLIITYKNAADLEIYKESFKFLYPEIDLKNVKVYNSTFSYILWYFFILFFFSFFYGLLYFYFYLFQEEKEHSENFYQVISFFPAHQIVKFVSNVTQSMLSPIATHPAIIKISVVDNLNKNKNFEEEKNNYITFVQACGHPKKTLGIYDFIDYGKSSTAKSNTYLSNKVFKLDLNHSNIISKSPFELIDYSATANMSYIKECKLNFDYYAKNNGISSQDLFKFHFEKAQEVNLFKLDEYFLLTPSAEKFVRIAILEGISDFESRNKFLTRLHFLIAEEKYTKEYLLEILLIVNRMRVNYLLLNPDLSAKELSRIRFEINITEKMLLEINQLPETFFSSVLPDNANFLKQMFISIWKSLPFKEKEKLHSDLNSSQQFITWQPFLGNSSSTKSFKTLALLDKDFIE